MVLELLSAQAFHCKVHSREITQKDSKREHPFLHDTHRLDLIYMPIKYYQNSSKGIKVIELTSFSLQTVRQIDGCQADRYIPEPCRSGDKFF